MHARAGPAKSVRSLGLRLATLGGFARAPLGAREPTAPTVQDKRPFAAASGVRCDYLVWRRDRGVPRWGTGSDGRLHADRSGTNGYDVRVVGEGSGPDAKMARRGPGGGQATGVGVAGYSRELLRGALIYAGRGIPVFPCEPWGKRPLTAGGFLEATTDEARIRGWWGRWPNANVAIPTGVRSGLLVLDVDAGEGTDSVALLELSRGQPPKTARAATGGGGQHLFFRYPSGQELRAAGLYTQQVRKSQGLLGDGLDVRGEGGYVVAPPSSTLRAYRWIDRAPPASADWLLECLRAATSGETLF
jgi:hypothetical protein